MTTWRDRIVASELRDPRVLVAHPDNWRAHPRAQQRLVADAIESVGLVRPVIVTRDDRIVDGHMRVALAIERGESSVPVDVVDLDERDELAVLATFDPIAELATHNTAQLGRLIGNVEIDMRAVAELLLPELRDDDTRSSGGGHSTAPSEPLPYDPPAPQVRQLALAFDAETHDQVVARMTEIARTRHLPSVSHVFWWLVTQYEQEHAR